MFRLFWKNKKHSKNEEKIKRKSIYLDNIKDASLFLDRAILLLSSAFLWFLFTQLNNLFKLKIELINQDYLKDSIILIGLTIYFVLLSYVATIDLAQLWYNIDNTKNKYRLFGIPVKPKTKFDSLKWFINFLRFLYLLTFIIAIIFTIIFYINNLDKYVL